MTETLQRPSRPSLPPRRPDGPAGRAALVTGALDALRAAGTGLLVLALPVLLVWATDARAGAGAADALRTAGQLWLLAHGASLEVPGGVVGLTPLGLAALPGWLLWRSARRAAAQQDAPPAAGRAAVLTAVPYALLAGLVALLARTDEVAAGVVPAVLWSFVLALVACAAGSLPGWRSEQPSRLGRLTRAAGGATAVLLGAGAALSAVALVLGFPRAVELAGSGDPGPVGGLALLAVGLALVPNAVVWGAAWLSGPGFAVGVGTAVGPFGHELGPVPALPLLAALPDAPAPGWAVLALTVPLAAGALAGRLVAADLPGAGAGRTALEAALVAPAAGLVLLVLAWLSGGPVGGERLTEVGPAPLAVGLAVAGLVGVAAVASASVVRYRSRD